MIRRPPRSTLYSSSAASDVYKRQPKYSGSRLVPGHAACQPLQCLRCSAAVSALRIMVRQEAFGDGGAVKAPAENQGFGYPNHHLCVIREGPGALCGVVEFLHCPVLALNVTWL